MARTEWGNQTVITEFVLLGFGDLQELQIFLFLPFLTIYIVTMAGNILIIALVLADQNLHTPMYFFLGNLSCLETCYTSTILPRMLATLLTGDRTISFLGCIMQYYFFGCLVATECYLLGAMSYDRYLAICKPLRYATLMNSKRTFQIAASSWICGLLTNTIITSLMSQLLFCGPNEIDHFFCDLTPVLNLSCSDARMVELVTFILASIGTMPLFLLTLMSYIYIMSAILRIPSTTGRQKAFSTCSSHLIVVTVFYGTLIIVYIVPETNALREVHKVLSLFYTVLTPMINPLIYSLRNKEVRNALDNAVNKFIVFRKSQAKSARFVSFNARCKRVSGN